MDFKLGGPVEMQGSQKVLLSCSGVVGGRSIAIASHCLPSLPVKSLSYLPLTCVDLKGLWNSSLFGSGSLRFKYKVRRTGKRALYRQRLLGFDLSEQSFKRFRDVGARVYRGKLVGDNEWMSGATPYEVLGVDEDSSEEEIKAAFRTRIKEYHPDVYQGTGNADAITQRLLKAYEVLTRDIDLQVRKRKSLDPFQDPECIAEDLFVNEVACIGRGCPYSCVERAPDVFAFAPDTGCATVIMQGAVGCRTVPKNCIHFLTPAQRTTVEELLQSAIEGTVYSGEIAMLDGLIAKANFENGRYQPPKRKPKKSGEWVDWF